MRITVRYLDGSVESFDTNALTTTSPLGRGNALTDLRVMLGEGLWVEASWYRAPQEQNDRAGLPLAQRSAGCRIHVLSEDEVPLVRSVELDGRVQWLRIGPDLCDVTRLDEMTDLLCSLSRTSSSLAERAVNAHDAIVALARTCGAQELDEDRALEMLGMTEASYELLSGVVANVYAGDSSF
ncbi:MAG: hypothetical protein IKG69_05990 [Atopobiaceae bacterium]|jgi:hypothetical protein|nr:hypothetical protein [Atopobiaceae bacterium]MBR3384735.1 hypothetical protein [Atopobiaceae bacterium]